MSDSTKQQKHQYVADLFSKYKTMSGERKNLVLESRYKDNDSKKIITTLYSSKDNIVYVFQFEDDDFNYEFLLKIKNEKPKGVRLIIVNPSHGSEEYIFDKD